MSGPDRSFWEQRFARNELPWDRGAPSPQLARWLPPLQALDGTIAVPGCGSGHEVAALAAAGCRVVGLDYAAEALARTRERLAGAPATLVEADVLAWQPAQPVAAVYEQTCLCALHPDHWVAYAAQLHRWLRPGGQLYLLALQVRRPGADDGLVEGPPYHVDINAVRALFPASAWQWPAPPYDRVPHPRGWFELALVLVRR